MPEALIVTPRQLLNAQYVCRRLTRFNKPVQHQLIPPRRADGNYVLDQNILTDPFYAEVRSILATGTIENVAQSDYASNPVITQFRPRVDGKDMYLSADGKPYSVTMPAANQYDFELWYGDRGLLTDPPGNRHRSEIVSTTGFMGTSSVLWWSDYFMVREMGVLAMPGSFGVVGQWHGWDTVFGRRPPFAFYTTQQGKLQVATASSNSLDGNGDGIVISRWVSAQVLNEGQFYRRVVKLTPSTGTLANGALDVYIDGVQVLGLTNIGTLYSHDASPGLVGQFGLYKSDRKHPDIQTAIANNLTTQEAIDAVPMSAVRYANVEFGTVSLLDRVANPLPI